MTLECLLTDIIARIFATSTNANERVAKAPNPLASRGSVDEQTSRRISVHLTQEVTRTASSITGLAIEKIPGGACLVDRMSGVVHGDHMQVESVVAKVEVSGAAFHKSSAFR